MSKLDFRIQDVRTPLGRIALGGRLLDHTGTPLVRDWQVRGAYSLACVTRGHGLYQDAFGRSERIESGDLILVFPDVGHRYGPEHSETWDECFVIFEGPIFDLWRAVGILRPGEPIARLAENADGWCFRVLACMEALSSNDTIVKFQLLVAAMLEPFSERPLDRPEPDWFSQVCTRLDRLEQAVDIDKLAVEAGVAVRTLRRQFQKVRGVSPQQYRDERRLRVALELLTHVPGIKLRTVALRIGFADEYYFSRWFKRKVGVVPSEWRRRPTTQL